MIDFDKFKYRIGDRIRRIGYIAEYEILAIDDINYWGYSHFYYKLKNLSKGCLDQPEWLSQGMVHMVYEPCNPMIKVLFSKPIFGTTVQDAINDIGSNNTTPHRVEEGLPDDHSLEALPGIIPNSEESVSVSDE